MSTRIPPRSSPIISDQVSTTSPDKQTTSPKNQQISDLGVKLLIQEPQKSTEDIPSLEEREINQEPPDEDDFSFLFDNILSGTDDLESVLDNKKEVQYSVNDSDEEIAEFIQENVSDLENEQKIEIKETSNLITAFAKQEVFKNEEVKAKQTEISLREIHAMADLMMKDKAKVIENATVTVRNKDLSVLKFVKDATPKELANAKPEDFGLVVGDRHLRHPNAKFKPGDMCVLEINGQRVQLRMEHMRQDQADKFQTIYKEHITQVLGNQPVKDRDDDEKEVKNNRIAQNLAPNVRNEEKKEKTETKRNGGSSVSKSEMKADLDASIAKASIAKDNAADEVRKKAVEKELSKKMVVEEDSSTVFQTTMHKPDDRTVRVKTSVKNSIKKNQG